jgi:hypothetical protein
MQATLTSQAKPAPTRRQYVEGILNAAEARARERKMPYLDMIAGLRKEMGTDAIVALIAKRCGPPFGEGPEVFKNYCALEIQRQSETALKAGMTDLIGWRYSEADVDFIVESLRKIVEALQ